MIALSDPVPQVRAQAVQLAARRLDRSLVLLEKILALATDPDSRVRFRVALALGETTTRGSRPLSCGSLAAMRRTGGSAPRCSARAPRRPTGCSWILERRQTIHGRRDGCSRTRPVPRSTGRDRRRPEPARRGRPRPRRPGGRARPGAAASAAGPAGPRPGSRLRRSGGRLAVDPTPRARARPCGTTGRARSRPPSSTSARPNPPGSTRSAHLVRLDPDGSQALLLRLLEPRQPLPVQVAAVQALARDDRPTSPNLAAAAARFEPAVRAAAVAALLGRARLDQGPAARRRRGDPTPRDQSLVHRAGRPRAAAEAPRPRDRPAGAGALRPARLALAGTGHRRLRNRGPAPRATPPAEPRSSTANARPATRSATADSRSGPT